MAAPSSVIPWRIPWTKVPGGLQSMGSETRLSGSAQHTARGFQESMNETCGFSLFLNPDTDVRNSILCF